MPAAHSAIEPKVNDLHRLVIERYGSAYRIILHGQGNRSVEIVSKIRGGVRTWRRLENAVAYAEKRFSGLQVCELRLRPQA